MADRTQAQNGLLNEDPDSKSLCRHSTQNLVSKLYHYGIRGIPHDWFRNYLHNRTQFVKLVLANLMLKPLLVEYHRDQLWVPYYSCFKSMTYCSKKLSFRIFADDTNMLFTSDNLLHLESIMNEELINNNKYGIYIALYPDAQSALQHFVGDFARLLIQAQIAATQFTILLKRIVVYTGAPRTE